MNPAESILNFSTSGVMADRDSKEKLSSNNSITNFTNQSSNSPFLSTVTDQFVSEASNVPKRLYCPFCLFDFGFEFLLKSHIRDTHLQEIEEFSQADLGSFKADSCTYCCATFYVDELLPKHVIRKHEGCILSLISTFDFYENVCCNFCPYRTSSRQVKLLFIHLENKHLNMFSKILFAYGLAASRMIPNLCRNSSDTSFFISDVKTKVRGNTKNETSDEKQKASVKPKPIFKKGSLCENLPTVRNAIEKELLTQTTKKLRFNLPDASFSSIESDKENFRIQNIDEKVSNLKIKKVTKKSVKIKPNMMPDTRSILGDITGFVNKSNLGDVTAQAFQVAKTLPFKCGVCSEKFCSNLVLRYHVKKKHGKIHCYPRYRCGLCKAKFFRNNFLILHNKLHHTHVQLLK